MTHINLLPWRARLREERKRKFFVILGGALISTLILLIIVHSIANVQLEHQSKRNLYLQQEIAVLDSQIADLKGMQRQKEELLARMEIIQELQANRLLVVHLFDDLVRLMPEGVLLTSIKREGQNITFQGRAQTNTGVSALMRNLEASQWYMQPILKEIKTDENSGLFNSSFILQVLQRMPMEREKPNAVKGH